MSFSNLEHFEGENGEKDYSKTEIYMLFLHSSLVIYEEVTESLEKNDLICLMLCVGYDKRSYKEKNSVFGSRFFGNRVLLNNNKKCHHSTAKSNRSFSISLLKL